MFFIKLRLKSCFNFFHFFVAAKLFLHPFHNDFFAKGIKRNHCLRVGLL